MPEHISKRCQIKGCDVEAEYWVSVNGKDTIYLCIDHQDELSDEDGDYIHLDIKTNRISHHEIGAYACDPDCDVCNT